MNKNTHSPNWAFRIMALIHDNPIRRKFSNPYQTLEYAGIRSGQKVLEIGCGPGFFTIPCSEIVGESGAVYALDNQPLAIKSVEKKIKNENISNITLLLENATNTSLPNQSIDVAFLFGVPRLLRDELLLKKVLTELNRVLRVGGLISIKSSGKNVREITEKASISFLRDQNGILMFNKK